MELIEVFAAMAALFAVVYGAPSGMAHPEPRAKASREIATTLFKLEEAKVAIDNLDISQPRVSESAGATGIGLASYYVDVESNKLVLEALSDSIAHAEALAKEVGLSESEFEVHTVLEMPSTFVTVSGGDAYWINRNGICTVGFTVTTGFITAGHCGSVGDSVSATRDGPFYGTFSGSIYPGRDMAYVRTVSGTNLLGYINGPGNPLPISGSTPAPVGASVCRSGRTTGVFCGTIRARNVTVNYAEGRVTGLVATNVCAEPGDSGGPWYSGSQAQGITSGGSGNCNTGGTTYFQPVNEILQAFGLTLVTA
jgi:streptogrisin C